MNKYIDSEKLKAEIKRQKHELEFSIQSQGDYGQSCHIVAYDNILSLIDSLQQEQPKEICSKCIHHGKDDDYCYNPHGGMQSLINENGVYECTGFCEQEHPEVDLDELLSGWMGHYAYENGGEYPSALDIAQHFYELGKNSKDV